MKMKRKRALYGADFYADRSTRTRHSAERILTLVLSELPTVQSAVDIGCGTGTWLSVAQRLGVARINGYDGQWVDPNLLDIPRDRFHQADLADAFTLAEPADLAICLEVLEHLPEPVALQRLQTITCNCKYLLIGAAIPMQGGTGHINEKPQRYWVDQLSRLGFDAFDWVRPRIWNDDDIPYWYKQNLIVYVRRDLVAVSGEGLRSTRVDEYHLIDIVHPGLLDKHYRKAMRKGGLSRWFGR